MKAFAPLALVALVGACSVDQPSAPLTSDIAPAANISAGSVYSYDVTITNLTTGQPMSPAIIITHGPRVSLFAGGRRASQGIKEIAEDGNPATAHAMLSGARGVFEAVATGAPIHRIGGPGPNVLTARISGDREKRFLSLATMLICSNDGFAGVSGVALPTSATPVTAYAYAYDAGTERNTEADGDIVPPCFGIGPTTGTGGGGHVGEQLNVRMHPGFDGPRALSPKLHGWSGPVAMVSIQLVPAS